MDYAGNCTDFGTGERGYYIMMMDKLRRYGIAATVLFLLVCGGSVLQHGSHLSSWFFALIAGIVGKLVTAALVIGFLLFILRMLLGVGRK